MKAPPKTTGALEKFKWMWITQADIDAMFTRASDAERHAAKRLRFEPALIKLSARILWDHRDFDDERDRRVGDIDALEPRSRQARRGLVTREMLAELRDFLEEVYADRSQRDAPEMEAGS